MTVKKLFKIFNLLSLDVVFGAMISSWMFWSLPYEPIKINYLAIGILGCSTWLFYILDRLVDNIHKEIKDERHQFHHTYQYNLQILAITLFFSSFVLAIFLPKPIIIIGIIQIILLIFYLWLISKFKSNKKVQQIKEIITAILYTFCIVGGAYSIRKNLFWEDYILVVNFFLLVHQSMLVFSYFEWHQDQQNANFFTLIGRKLSHWDIYGIFILQLILIGFYIESKIFEIVLIQALMSFSTMLIYHFSDYPIIKEKYRILGEMVFCLPILLQFFIFFC